jgi:N-acetylmuramoyl-L-alanine amidase
MKRIILIALVFLSLQSKAQDSITSFWLGRSVGKLPALAAGLGDDRLGGAKLGYLDTNIVLKVIDSVNNLYQVQLSQYHTAYIEKGYIKRDSSIVEKPFYLTHSWQVMGTDSNFDILSIRLDEKLPYKSWMEINPSKIILDIYGVQSNTNWITQLTTLKEIKNIYYNQVEDDVVRVTIELRHVQHWGYSISYTGKALVMKVKHQPERLNIKYIKVAIDAGHGGTNLGAEGNRSKAIEKEYTLVFAKALQRKLMRKKVEVIMTRTIDTTFDLKDRILYLQQRNPDLLISLHLNSNDNTNANGSSTYYKHIGFRPISQTILKRMLDIKMNEFGNVGNFNFTLNAPTDFVNTLLEIGFLSNTEDELRITDPRFPAKVAKQVARGIKDWLLQCKNIKQ